jgi:hypothetical protein
LHYGGIGSAAVSVIRRKVRDLEHAARPAIDVLLGRLAPGRQRNVKVKA